MMWLGWLLAWLVSWWVVCGTVSVCAVLCVVVGYRFRGSVCVLYGVGDVDD